MRITFHLFGWVEMRQRAFLVEGQEDTDPDLGGDHQHSQRPKDQQGEWPARHRYRGDHEQQSDGGQPAAENQMGYMARLVTREVMHESSPARGFEKACV